MRVLAPLLGVSLLAAAALPALAETRTVPSDAHPTIQSAVDASADGDVIVVKKGVYAENVMVSGRANLTIIGKGKPVIDGSDDGDCIRVSGSDGIIIKGFVLRNASGAAVHVEDSDSVTVEKCLVDGGSGDGVYADEPCEGVSVLKTQIRGIGGTGVRSFRSTDLVVEKCRIEDTGGAGVSLAEFDGFGSPGARVSRTRITRPGSAGVNAGGSNQVLERNVILDAVREGIHSESTTAMNGGRIERNRVVRPGHAGIRVEGGGVAVEGNAVSFAGHDGLTVWGLGSGVVLVEENRVIGAAWDGISAAGQDVTVRGNKVLRCTTGVREKFGSGLGGIVFEGNRVQKSLEYGIYLTGSGVTVVGNVALKSGLFDLFDTIGGNTIEGNRFGTIGSGE